MKRSSSKDQRRRFVSAITWTRAASVALLVVGCGTSGTYVPVEELPPAMFARRDTTRYVIALGDILNIRVYTQDALSGKVRVRPDGRVTMPLVGEVDAKGRTIEDLSAYLTTRFKEFVNVPSVSIVLEERAPVQVTVVGEVARQGVFNVDSGSSVLQVLAQAGGPTDFASHSRIFVLRRPDPAGPIRRIRFSYDLLARGEGVGSLFTIQTGDVVVVE